MQSRLSRFHAFRLLNLPHMQYVQEWVSVRFGFLSLRQHLNGHIGFQERVGGWHSPPAQVPNAAFQKSAGPFPRVWPYRGPFVLLFLCICFAFFFCFLPQLFPVSFKKYPVLEVPNSDRGPSLRPATCPLGGREPQHCALFFGFTGSPRTSLFKFNVSFVLRAGFTTLSRLICCFHVCCIWHFPFSLVAFICLYSTYHVASFQLALVPSMCSSFVKCAPFQVAFALSIFPPFAVCCLFSTCVLLSHLFCNCHVCLFQICIFHLFALLLHFSRFKHPRTSAIRQHNSSYSN